MRAIVIDHFGGLDSLVIDIREAHRVMEAK
jgi:hypothetical protein